MISTFAKQELASMKLALYGESGERGQHATIGFHALGYFRPIVGRDSQAGQCEKG